MSYLVATDLDGTLLRHDFTVSARTRQALADAVAARIAAPVGVIVSKGARPDFMGMPLRISAVAGAGTGKIPWAQRRKPPPT